MFFFIRFPFDWRNPLGYLMACTSEYIGLITVARVGLQIIIFLSGSCWLLISMAHDIKCELRTIADIMKTKHTLSNELSEFIEFHSNVIQLSEVFCKLFTVQFGLYFYDLLQTCTSICTCLSIHFICDVVMDCGIFVRITIVISNRISSVNSHNLTLSCTDLFVNNGFILLNIVYFSRNHRLTLFC